ncbi:7029_t:CDS:1, partial [Gigaspora margarita]
KSIKDVNVLNDRKFRFLLKIFIALVLITIFSTINHNNGVLIDVNVIIPQHSSYQLNVIKDKRPPDGYVLDLN